MCWKHQDSAIGSAIYCTSMSNFCLETLKDKMVKKSATNISMLMKKVMTYSY